MNKEHLGVCGMSDMEKRAMSFSFERHSGQRRKYTGFPYITHPSAVAELVRMVEHTEEMLAAAWLHDVVEDTRTTLKEVGSLFGPDVLEMVGYLTNVSVPEDGNRRTRKDIDLKHLSSSTPRTKTIKLADIIDNCRSILEHDEKFAKVYIREKVRALGFLRDGDKWLYTIACGIVGTNGEYDLGPKSTDANNKKLKLA